MNAEEILFESEEHMEKSIDVLKRALSGIRTGRANPGLVDSLKVDVYGSPTTLKAIASVGAPEPTQIVIRPFDPSTIKDIEKAIIASELRMTPQSDGKVIRLNVPALSTEVRKQMVGRIRDLLEECKVSIRSIRRDGNKHADQAEKDKILTEDDCAKVKEEIQELTKKYENLGGEMAKKRETEVLEG